MDYRHNPCSRRRVHRIAKGLMMIAYIKSIEYHLPERRLSNEDLHVEFPEWSINKIEKKTGIKTRPIAAQDECASDLGEKAAKQVFESGAISPEKIDYLIFCTQSPDYFLPTTACLIQDKLNLPVSAGAIDINLGCSGYIYGLGIAKGLIETGQARNVLFITAETYSKFINPRDKSVRTLFGDAGAATLLSVSDLKDQASIGPFVYGTDGKGANNLIVPNGGLRSPIKKTPEKIIRDENDNYRSSENLYMNGSEIFTFTLKRVPEIIHQLLNKQSLLMDDIDHFVFHQANKFMLDHLRRKLKIPEEKFCTAYEESGNTVSSTIPIALKGLMKSGGLKENDILMLVGFGVGYSWGATLVKWGKCESQND